MVMSVVSIFLVAFTALNSNQIAAKNSDLSCDAYLKAHYSVSKIINKESDHSSHDHHHGQPHVMNNEVVLWRNQKQVAIHYPGAKITEVWERTKKGKLFLIRYFDAHKRGIEYQPNEIEGSHDWSQKRQMVSDLLLGRMTLVNEQGSDGCNASNEMVYSDGVRRFELTWFFNQKIAGKFFVEGVESRNRVEWTLESLEQNKGLVEEKFAQLAGFQTTDYTDIGDNESDPFLLNMINLGFIDHGNSGFYDSEGNDIGGEHQH